MDPKERRSSIAPLNEKTEVTQADRLHRQARQSILYEERSTPAFRDDLFSSLPPFRTQGLGRTGTSGTDISPTDDPHPGTKISESSLGWNARRRQSLRQLSEIFPIPRGSIERPRPTRRKSSVAVQLPSLDEEAADGQIDEATDQHIQDETAPSLLSRLGSLIPKSGSIKPGAISGLKVASGAATAHAKAILHHQNYLHSSRQYVFITEYTKDSVKPIRIPMSLNHISGIQHYLMEASKPRFTPPSLRLIYVQNNEEAMDFLTGVFRLDHPSFEKFEGSFKDWVHETRTHQGRLAKTVSWKPSCDLTRDITCTLFGLDLGSGLESPASKIPLPGKKGPNSQAPKQGPNAPRPQRLSVYLQRTLDGFPEPGKMGIFNTTATEKWQCAHQNTILIFETSHDDRDEIIEGDALLDLEWQQNPHIIPSTPERNPDPNAALISTMEHILLHVFTRVLRAWRTQFSLLSIQHSTLEDRVYGQPSDDTHAPELWAMSKYLWAMSKLANRHSNLLEDVQENFNQFAERDRWGAASPGLGGASGGADDYNMNMNMNIPLNIPLNYSNSWLDALLRDFRSASITIQEDFIRPTEHMIDLVYKSVSIRDSRQSLELNASLWRLSWITFIFLPLTFLVGFFGMNVSIFEHDPSVKYYFVAAVPLMTLILVVLFVVRHYVPADKNLRSFYRTDGAGAGKGEAD